MAVNERDLEHPDDARIAALYSEAEANELPGSVDAAILRNARSALQPPAKTRTSWWLQWRVPFAFAAIAVLSVSTVLMVEKEGGEPLKLETDKRETALPRRVPPAAESATTAVPDAQRDSTSSQPSSAATAVPPRTIGREPSPARPKESTPEAARGERARKNDVPREGESAGLSQRQEKPLTNPPGSSASDTPAAALRSAPAPEAPAALEERARAPAPPPPAAPSQTMQSGPQPAMAPAAPVEAKPYAAPAAKAAPQQRPPAATDAVSASATSLIAELDKRPAAEWRDRIAALRREGRDADAEAVLAEFKRRFPDEPQPPTP